MPTFLMRCCNTEHEAPSCTAEDMERWGKYDEVMSLKCENCGGTLRQIITGTGGYIWKARGYGGPNEGTIDRKSIEFGKVTPNSDGFMRFQKV